MALEAGSESWKAKDCEDHCDHEEAIKELDGVNEISVLVDFCLDEVVVLDFGYEEHDGKLILWI